MLNQPRVRPAVLLVFAHRILLLPTMLAFHERCMQGAGCGTASITAMPHCCHFYKQKDHGRPQYVAICRMRLLTSVVSVGVCLLAALSWSRLSYSLLQPHCRYAALPCPAGMLPCPVYALCLHLVSLRHTLPANAPCFGCCTDESASHFTRDTLPAKPPCFGCFTDAHAVMPQR